VTAEQQRLQGIFLNLINNAFDAMAPQGRGELRVSAVAGPDTIEIRFDDDGPGMASPAHVFEPFYTTKAVGEGTGLGLALVNRFVEAFGGSIRASNRPDGGARFEVTLLLAPAGVVKPVETGRVLPRGSQTRPRHVLVVEDEEPLRRLSAQVLARLDVEVHLASSAAEARTVLDTVRIDVVISDVTMPGESGVSLYRWIQATRPELANRFLFVTGDVYSVELAGLVEEIPEAFLQKPFDLRDYLARVQALLEL
jgi:two-component system NtrC family sensor kinase